MAESVDPRIPMIGEPTNREAWDRLHVPDYDNGGLDKWEPRETSSSVPSFSTLGSAPGSGFTQDASPPYAEQMSTADTGRVSAAVTAPNPTPPGVAVQQQVSTTTIKTYTIPEAQFLALIGASSGEVINSIEVMTGAAPVGQTTPSVFIIAETQQVT